MCKEHLGVALALKVPVFFVVTKVDICPGHVLQHSLATLSSILRKPGIKKKPYMVIGLSPDTLLVMMDSIESLELGMPCPLQNGTFSSAPLHVRWLEAEDSLAICRSGPKRMS